MYFDSSLLLTCVFIIVTMVLKFSYVKWCPINFDRHVPYRTAIRVYSLNFYYITLTTIIINTHSLIRIRKFNFYILVYCIDSRMDN